MIQALRVYSPSQTSDWSFCPIYRHLKSVEGWKPIRLGKKELGGILGTAFASAMEVYNLGKMQGQIRLDEVIGEGVSVAERLQSDLLKEGHTIGDWDMAQWNNIVPKVKLAIEKYAKNDPINELYEIEAVELVLPQSGYSRIDLVVRDKWGPMVVDYKCKGNLESKWRDKEIERYRNSWQLLHYTNEYGEYKKEMPTRFGIVLVVAAPKFSAELIEYPVHPETLALWKSTAQEAWGHMYRQEQGEEELWMNTSHETVYGPCEFKKACFEYRFDEELMKQDYIRKVKESSENASEVQS